MIDEFRSKRSRRELSKNITNLDGSDPITSRDGSRRVPPSVEPKELQARWSLAFGKITQEEFDDILGELEDEDEDE